MPESASPAQSKPYKRGDVRTSEQGTPVYCQGLLPKGCPDAQRFKHLSDHFRQHGISVLDQNEDGQEYLAIFHSLHPDNPNHFLQVG